MALMANDSLTVDKNSMFVRTPAYRVDDVVVFGLRREVIVPDVTDMIIEVTQAMSGRLDLLSYELYGTSDLWWVICDLNQIVDPMTEANTGAQLRVPRRDRLFSVLST